MGPREGDGSSDRIQCRFCPLLLLLLLSSAASGAGPTADGDSGGSDFDVVAVVPS